MARKKNDGALVVAEALAGLDCKAFVVNSRRYVVHPPTIRRLALAGAHLAGFDTGETVGDLLSAISDMGRLSAALSCLVAGDESLAAELSEGTPAEVVGGLETAYGMIDPRVFMKAVGLARSVAGLIAQPR